MNLNRLNKLSKMLTNCGIEKPEKGYHTRLEYQNGWGISEKAANIKIRKGLNMGHLKEKMFKIRTGQVVRPVPHYKIV